MKKLIIICLVLLQAGFVMAQNKDSLWTTNIGAAIEWMDIAPDGTLITANFEVGNSGSPDDVYTRISGIDPANGTIKWNYKTARKYRTPRFDPVQNTPYIQFADIPLTILDPTDGHVIIDIAKEGITNTHAYGYLLESGNLWIDGVTDGTHSLSLFDLATGKKIWTNTDVFKSGEKSKLGKFAAFAAAQTGNSTAPKSLCSPINHGSENMIIATTSGVSQINIATGKSSWTAELPDPNKGKMIKVDVDVNFAKLIPGPDYFFVVKAAYIIACSYDDGKPVWKNPVKTSGAISTIIYDEKGLILCPGSSNVKGVVATGLLKMVNAQTGEELWGDGLKFNGAITQYNYTEKGLAVVMESSVDDTNAINFIDVAAGKYVLSKNVSLKGVVQYIEYTPKGLLYRTDRAVNILGFDGTTLMDLPIQTVRENPILTGDGGAKYYFYSEKDNNLYEIDKASATGRVMNATKVNFSGGESPDMMDVRSDGVVLFSPQNLVKYSFSGTRNFTVYNPGVSDINTKLKTAGQILNAVSNVAAAAAAMDVASTTRQQLSNSSSFTPQQKTLLQNKLDAP